MLNPINFNKGDFLRSVYSDKYYEVIEPDKRGMATLYDIETGRSETWNSCNNPHFEKKQPQLKLEL